MTKYDIFMSYAHGKNDYLVKQAYGIYLELKKAGFSVWFDMIEMKTCTSRLQEQRAMKLGIKNSKILLALIGPEYMNSYNCNFEYLHALNKPIIHCSINSKYLYKRTDFKHLNFPLNEELPIINTLSTHNFGNAVKLLITQIRHLPGIN
jgi:hypothetical protein